MTEVSHEHLLYTGIIVALRDTAVLDPPMRKASSQPHRRPRRALLGLAALWLGWAATAAAEWRAVAEAFDARFSQTLRAADVPGGAYAIVQGGQILALGSHGHIDQQRTRRIDSATVFRIASLSKGFSGVLAALIAAERGFSLAQPVATYSTSFQLRGDSRPLTIEDVLGQRSGFIRNAYDNLIEAGIPRSEILSRFKSLDPICAPGECYSYQNNVFSLVEDVIAEAADTDYDVAVAERLFDPLGMARASVGFDALVAEANRADPHLKTRAGWRPTAPRATYYQVPSAAGINASILDMAQWTLTMLGHRPDVVPKTVVDEVLTPRIRTGRELRKRHWRGALEDAWYGLGWRIYRVRGHHLALHAGWVAGYRAEIALSRELDLGIVILSNAETRAIGALNRAFWDLALSPEILAGHPNAAQSGPMSAASTGPGS